MSNPSRADLISAYWLDGLSLAETGQLYGLGYRATKRLFQRLGILTRVRRGKHINAERLELMLWPSVVEYERERVRALLPRSEP